jgi:outer membrane protein insertion porin family
VKRLAASLLLTTALAAADPTIQVTDVVIEGARHIHPDRVRFILDARPGRSYSQGQLQLAVADDVRAIERMGPFTSVTSSLRYGDDGTSVTVVYRFTELPYIGNVRFETWQRVIRRGGQWRPVVGTAEGSSYDELGYFDKEKLEKVVETRPGSYLNPILVENDRRAVLRKLNDDGHRYARVEVETVEEAGTTAIIFRIDIGQTVEVGKVIIEGLPKGVTMRAFEPGAYNPVGLFNAEGKPYQADLVQLDEGTIIRTLQDQGWLDARLVATRREITDYIRPTDERRRHGPDLAPDALYNDRVVLIYTVEPGARYRLGQVSFIGNTVASGESLLEAFAMEQGAWFRRLDLEGDPREGRLGRDRFRALGAIERARRVISNTGRARCQFRPDRRLDTMNHIVDLVIHVDEGGIYRLGRLDIHGNTVTRDAIVRRAMSLNPGDLWNDDELDDSRRQIERTGIFADRSRPPRPLRLSPEFPEDRPGTVNLLVEVDEQPSGSLRFEVGYSSASGIFGQLEYTEHNLDLMGILTGSAFRGGNQDLSFSIYASENRKSLSSTWTNPHVFDGPYATSVTGFRSDSDPYEWQEIRLGGSLSISRSFLRNDLSLGTTYGYTDLRVEDRSVNAGDNVVVGKYFWNSVGLFQSYDRLDNRRMPTSGYQLKANQTSNAEPLPGTIPWAEFGHSADGYLPLHQTDDGGVSYLRFSGRYKLATALSDENVPFFARYRGGGPAPRHRGFEPGRLSPTRVNAAGYRSRIGGVQDALATMEASVPVMGTNEGLRLVGFADYGGVMEENVPLTLGSMRTAVGFGVRFPVQLPVSIDFAWLLGDRHEGEGATQIHFGLGATSF